MEAMKGNYHLQKTPKESFRTMERRKSAQWANVQWAMHHSNQLSTKKIRINDK